MKFKFPRLMLALLLFSGLFSTGSPAASEGIRWHGYTAGMELGKKENKKIFLHFRADWCDSCRKMDKETFTDSAVIAYLNKHFISIGVDADKERAILAAHNVRGLPDSWFVSEKNEAIGNQPGYIPPDRLISILRYIQTDSYKKMPYSKFLEIK